MAISTNPPKVESVPQRHLETLLAEPAVPVALAGVALRPRPEMPARMLVTEWERMVPRVQELPVTVVRQPAT
jgi:hypothetical protein